MVFRSIGSQLAKPNEKFMYCAVREGGRARDIEEAIEWLVSAGMLSRVHNVSRMEHPLAALDKLDRFKLFIFDIGLLKHIAGIDNSAILLKSDYLFKGPLTNNFVLQVGTEIIPIDAKGEEDKSALSFKRYIGILQSVNRNAHFISPSGGIANLPFYLV